MTKMNTITMLKAQAQVAMTISWQLCKFQIQQNVEKKRVEGKQVSTFIDLLFTMHTLIVATLALGSQPRQGVARLQAKRKEARESRQRHGKVAS
jgi:hypothetical protein